MPCFHRAKVIVVVMIIATSLNWVHSISLGLFSLNESDSDITKNGCRTHYLAMSRVLLPSLLLCGNRALKDRRFFSCFWNKYWWSQYDPSHCNSELSCWNFYNGSQLVFRIFGLSYERPYLVLALNLIWKVACNPL